MRSITYQIEKTQTYENVNVTKKDNYPGHGFLTCVHIANKGYGYQNICVKYANSTIVNENKQKTVEIQGIVYTEFQVYLSSKTRERNSTETINTTASPVDTSESIPLLVKITKKGQPNDPDYYVPNPKENDYKWVNLKELIGDFLDYIGFSTDHNKLGHDVLESLLKSAGIEHTNTKIKDKLKRLKGSEINKFLEQEICETLNRHGHGHEHCHHSHRSLLILLLRKIEFDLLDSVIILLDRTIHDKQYGKKEIKKVIGIKNMLTVKNTNITVSAHKEEFEATTHQPETSTPFEASGAHSNVTEHATEQSDVEEDYDYDEAEEEEEHEEEHEDEYTDLKKGYRCHYHNIKVRGHSTSTSERKGKIYLSFYIGMCQIDMYNHHGKDIEDIVYDHTDTKVCVYFFKPDHMPIMLYYKGTAYAPKSLPEYYSRWESVEGIDSSNCSIEQENNTALLEALIKVLYVINPVKINIPPSQGYSSYYTTHIYEGKGQHVNINVDITYEDMKRHKEIIHQAGFPCHVLGQIAYRGHKVFHNYEEYKKQAKRDHRLPDSVSAYFFMYDYKYEYPLMVELFYFDITEHGLILDTNDYYELSSIDNGELKWKKIANNGPGEKSDDFIHKIKKAEDDINRIVQEKAEKVAKLERDHKDAESEELLKNLKSEQAKSHDRKLAIIEEKLDEIRMRLGIKFVETEDHIILKHYEKNLHHSHAGLIVALISVLLILGAGTGIMYYRYSHLVRYVYRELF